MKKRNTTKQLLFCPGPVNLATNVKQAAIQEEIGHRETEFEQLLVRLQQNVLRVLEVKQPKDYAVVFVTGSGTAGNETILASLGRKRLLVLTNGEFGERLLTIAKLHHKHVKQLDFGWGNPIDSRKVQAYLQNHPIDTIVMVHHETSSGMLNPIYPIGVIAYQHGAQFIVDAVSSATAESIRIEDSHITFLNTTSGKAVAAFPGIAIIVGRKEAFTALATTQPQSVYLNLYNFYSYITAHNQTPNTPGVPLFFALDQALKNIFTEGIIARRRRITSLAYYMRGKLQAMGLSLLLTTNLSSVVTSVYLPTQVSFQKLQQEFRQRNIIIYSGKGPFTGKIFQIGHIGELTISDADYFLTCLDEIIRSSSQAVLRKRQTTSFFPTYFSAFSQRIQRVLIS